MTTAIGSSTPPNSAPSLGADDDAMSALYVTLSQLQQNDVTAGTNQVEENETNERQEQAAESKALQNQQANQGNAGGGFFSCVGHFFGDVATDLVHGRFGSAIDDAGRDLDQAWNSPRFWSDLKTGLEDIGMVAAAVGTAVTTAGIGTAAIAAVATGVGVVAAGGAGLAEGRVEHFAGAAEDAGADATEASHDIENLQQVTADVLADLKQTDKSHQQGLQSLTQAMQTNDDALVAAASTTVQG